MINKISEYKEQIKGPVLQTTLAYLIKDNQILLAMKKRGFAAGKWNGTGGKKKDGETVEEAAKREANEEIGIGIKKLNKVATLNFYFLNRSDWNNHTSVYLVDSWIGEPTESEEMSPKWFELDKIPYDKMWEDDALWLPKVLNRIKIEADFLFDENQKMIDKDIREI